MEIKKYEQVWEIWVESKDRLFAYALSRFKEKELAEDVVQEVLLKLHKSCCSGKEINNLNAWLYQITHNASLDILKKEAKNRELSQIESTNSSVLLEEISSFIKPLIEILPEKYAIPLKMSDLEGIPQKEIANKLGLGLSATKSRIQRARTQLKELIITCFHIETDKNGALISADLKQTCKPLNDLNTG